MHISEQIFIENFFDHNDWKPQPRTFKLIGATYRPDFYDNRRGVYIEVVGSPSAYHMGKRKYWMFKALYPGLTLELRRPSGDLFVPHDQIEESFMLLSYKYHVLKALGLPIDEAIDGKIPLDDLMREARALKTKEVTIKATVEEK